MSTVTTVNEPTGTTMTIKNNHSLMRQRRRRQQRQRFTLEQHQRWQRRQEEGTGTLTTIRNGSATTTAHNKTIVTMEQQQQESFTREQRQRWPRTSFLRGNSDDDGDKPIHIPSSPVLCCSSPCYLVYPTHPPLVPSLFL
uniref:Uncharacterized protein n=1 Tax=Grammatophora oceanica TaxID=210454 RepID=A0A7S1Y235_9STRA|mmetsp:Transcript_19899/g.29453  ORF Transcript_19899/g.29453 Transcript_19899/m.29453 type:complete len:140 (+) Transcript_19899:177-596(+)